MALQPMDRTDRGRHFFHGKTRKAEDIYKNIDNPVWRCVVYDRLHKGREFTNMAGQKFLDFLAARAKLCAGMRVVELCSGTGAMSRYIAEKFAADVVGIEINMRQVRLARQRWASSSRRLTPSVQFKRADVMKWKPSTVFDVAFVAESLVLVDDPRHVLRTIYRSLKPGGYLFIADTLAGVAITPEISRKARLEDGMVGLVTLRECTKALHQIGFTDVWVYDKTRLATVAFKEIARAVVKHRDMISRIEGVSGAARWRSVSTFYRDCFSEGSFSYAWISARRPK